MNDETTPETPRFDLFATEVEDNLKEELAKGTFQWTNKYTRILGGVFLIVGLLAVGTWYGHYEATKSTTTGVRSSFSSLRAAFGGGGGFGGFGGGTGSTTGGTTSTGTGSTGGFGGFGGTRVTGIIKSVNGSTVTITLNDPTQATSLTSGDVARVTDTGTATSGSGGTSTSNTAINPPANAPANTGAAASGATTTNGAPAPAATPAATNGTARRGGFFSNPQLVACLKKAGITITTGSRPNFQDPATAQAIQTCFTQLGITPGGGFRGGAAGGAAPTPTATK